MFYAIAGDGTGNKTEILKTLADLKDKAAQDDAEFWFVITAKEEPNKTEKDILNWFRQDPPVWFEVIGEDDDDVYAGAQNYHAVKNPNQKMLGMMGKAAEEGEDVALLTLFVDPEDEDDADSDLMTLVEKAVDDGREVFMLNGQMQKLSFGEGGDEDEGDETPEDEAAADDGPAVFTREELTKMQTAELSGIATGQKINPKGLGKRDLIEAILAAQEGGAPAEEAPKPTKAASKKAPAKAAAPAKKAAKKAAAATAEEDEPTLMDEAVEAVEEILSSSTNGDNLALVVVHYQGRILTAQVPAAQAMAMVVQ